ncbi:TlpA family protein disulfide reductase [Candidatus Neomarinimicrobiota bacterium]
MTNSQNKYWNRFSDLLMIVVLLSGCGQRLELQTTTADQLMATIARSQGKNAVLVNFWATWCVPCVEEFPMIVELGNSLAGDGLITYFVSVDFIDDQPRVEEFLESQDVRSLSFIKDQKDMPFINGISEAWTGAVPFTMLVGRNSGAVVAAWEGKAGRDKFETAARLALAN